MFSGYRNIAVAIVAAAAAWPGAVSAGPASSVSIMLPECARFVAAQAYRHTGRYDLLLAFDAINVACAPHVQAYGAIHTVQAARNLAMQAALETKMEMLGVIRR